MSIVMAFPEARPSPLLIAMTIDNSICLFLRTFLKRAVTRKEPSGAQDRCNGRLVRCRHETKNDSPTQH